MTQLAKMLDPDTLMKNSPFQIAHKDKYNLSNTTPELLKFQLQEQTRQPASLAPLLMDAEYNAHLQAVLDSNNLSIDYENDENDEFLRNGVSGSSTPSLEVLETLKLEPNYMNLRILVENSVFDSLKTATSSILPLHKVRELKLIIADKKDHKEYLEQRIAISNQFCSTLLANPEVDATDVDSGLLLKIFKQNIALQQQLMSISGELEQLSQKLTNHNVACLVLGYVKDVEMSRSVLAFNLNTNSEDSPVDASSQQSFETLFAHIASLAVQKNVTLPDHTVDLDNTLQGKIAWAQNCIDAVVNSNTRPSTAATGELTRNADTSLNEDNSVLKDHSFLSASPYENLKNDPSDKTLSEYKIALNDLRFSHQFFMKEYEYLKENSLKTILEYRRKNSALEKEIASSRNGSSVALGESSRDSLDAKDKEIAKLQKEINLMKVEMLGNKSPRNSTIASPSLLSQADSDEESPSQTIPNNTHKYGSLLMSNAILRKEFKKMVADIQDRYEIELGEERLQRRQLEDKLQKMQLR